MNHVVLIGFPSPLARVKSDIQNMLARGWTKVSVPSCMGQNSKELS